MHFCAKHLKFPKMELSFIMEKDFWASKTKNKRTLIFSTFSMDIPWFYVSLHSETFETVLSFWMAQPSHLHVHHPLIPLKLPSLNFAPPQNPRLLDPTQKASSFSTHVLTNSVTLSLSHSPSPMVLFFFWQGCLKCTWPHLAEPFFCKKANCFISQVTKLHNQDTFATNKLSLTCNCAKCECWFSITHH